MSETAEKLPRPNWVDEDGERFVEWSVPLRDTIRHGERTWDEIPLREPKAIHVKRAEAELKAMTPEAMRAYEFRLISEVSGIPIPALHEVPVSRLNEAATYLASFVEGGRVTAVRS